ncbi:hypothetical protein K8R03_02785 [Candidatus Kaiserbacteria bacterium]|nr:hypothetical protein [Candidatus Kaiserbacteria bacterium]
MFAKDTRTSVSKLAAVFAVLVGIMSAVAAYVSERTQSIAFAQGEACARYGNSDTAASVQNTSNPDTLLFVTCGGFLE